MRKLAEAWRGVGADIDIMEGPDVERLSGSRAYQFAIFHKRGGHVHPLSLTRGFARAAAANGARLYENAAVTKLTRVEGQWKVSTATGSVTAPKVILTTNAYTTDLWPSLKQTFYPMTSIALATAPLSDNLKKTVLPGGVTISDTRRAIYFARYDRDHRLIFGCVGSQDNVKSMGGLGGYTEGLARFFRSLAKRRLRPLGLAGSLLRPK